VNRAFVGASTIADRYLVGATRRQDVDRVGWAVGGSADPTVRVADHLRFAQSGTTGPVVTGSIAADLETDLDTGDKDSAMSVRVTHSSRDAVMPPQIARAVGDTKPGWRCRVATYGVPR
jgi:hypothetical protein